MFCQIKYTPLPRPWAYPEAMRKKAPQLYVDGMSLRRIARHLGAHHRTVFLWIQAQADQMPDPPIPSQVKEAEMDERFTLIGEKKTIYVITIIDRFTRCYLGFNAVWQRTREVLQEMMDEAPKARRYYRDAFDAYERLWYHGGIDEVSRGKTDTCSVEGNNAELRYHLARLARRLHCFSRCPKVLKAALKLFICCFNRRQLHRQRFSNDPAEVFQFVWPNV